jgi:hypothetical protein
MVLARLPQQQARYVSGMLCDVHLASILVA